ncbi:hypothetical protein KX724_07660 [Stenotrophomonas indicatrix]|uniref:hypothetical protein n=1 Tax=Stenotrophomonas indicatrix TaxID=2045451 RepID=UPI001C500339|nr:hypothetical protein [Stenotrophomonas indicatrix]QXQ03958.1 hypothetical protein KX724_07660 [Stenotrophomonas indicatrix]
MSDWIENATLVATSLSAVGALAAAVATYFGVAAPAAQRKRDARAVALASMDAYLSELVSLRETFAINSLVLAGARRAWDEHGDADAIALDVHTRAKVPDVPVLPVDWHNLEISIALNRLRSSLVSWERAAATFSLDARAFFHDADAWIDHAFSYLEELRADVMVNIRNVGKLIEPVLLEDRKSELAKILVPHDGLDFAIKRADEIRRGNPA